MSRDEKVVSTELRVHAGHALDFVQSFSLKSSLVLFFLQALPVTHSVSDSPLFTKKYL